MNVANSGDSGFMTIVCVWLIKQTEKILWNASKT
jgi:hypothetical protein